MKDFSSINTIADSFVADIKDGERWKLVFPRIWETLLGEDIAKNTTPSGYEDGVLYIKTAGPRWKTQLESISDILIKRFRNNLPENFNVEELVFEEGSVKTSDREEVSEKELPKAETNKKVAGKAKQIKNEKLRKQIVKTASVYLEATKDK